MANVIFFGTPKIAVPFLNFLCQEHRVVAVVTRKDKPAGRGQTLLPGAVKTAAAAFALPVFHPENLKSAEFLELLVQLKADVGIVVAYGRLIPPELIQIFSKGLYNIHFSLLPKLRGGAPMQWAILNGEKVSGVSLFRIVEGLDSGPILGQKILELDAEEDAISLEKKMVPTGIELLRELLPKIDRGEVTETEQTANATVAPVLNKSDAKINWNSEAEKIHNQVRAWVCLGAYTLLPNGKKLKILKAAVYDDPALPLTLTEKSAPGQVILTLKNKGFVVKCKVRNLLVLQVQPEGKKEMDAWSFLQGRALELGQIFL